MNNRKLKHILMLLLICITIKAQADSTALPLGKLGKKFRILSIDGGGVRGIIPARILQAIEEQTGKRICELFDLIIGNSTGGLIALALVAPDKEGKSLYKAVNLVEFYKQKTSKIFSRSWARNIKTGWGLWGPRYDRENLDAVLVELLGDTKLSQTLKPAVVISYSLNYGVPHMWSTFHASHSPNEDYYLRDVAGATSAAPTYFAPKVLKTAKGELLHEIDGGIWANNPEFTAIRALSFIKPIPKNEDVILISVGTGTCSSHKATALQQLSKLKNAGVVGWMMNAQPNLIEMMMDADGDWSETLISLLYPNSHRIQIDIPHELSSMDKPENVEKLSQLAESHVQKDFFKKLCDQLMEP